MDFTTLFMIYWIHHNNAVKRNGGYKSLKAKVDKLLLGQLEIQKEMYMLDRKISDTYNVVLDALGTSAENRIWLEKGALV